MTSVMRLAGTNGGIRLMAKRGWDLSSPSHSLVRLIARRDFFPDEQHVLGR